MEAWWTYLSFVFLCGIFCLLVYEILPVLKRIAKALEKIVPEVSNVARDTCSLSSALENIAAEVEKDVNKDEKKPS